MNTLFNKILVAIGLYNVRSIISKFYELFILNNRRYFHCSMENMEEPIFSDKKYEQTPTICTHECITIYYLVHCFYPFSQGGTERFIYNMALEAKKKGNRVRIVTYNATKDRKQFTNQVSGILFNEYQIDGLDVVEYRHTRAPLGILKDVLVSDNNVYAFAEHLFSREKPDFLHVGYIQKVSSFVTACKNMHIPYGITLTSYYSLCHYDSMIDRKGRLCSGSEQGIKCQTNCRCLDIADIRVRFQNMRDLLKDAVFVAAPSRFVKKMVEKDFRDIKVLVINHGVSRDFITEETGIGSKCTNIKNFAYVGSLSPIKGIHGLIKAFMELPSGYTLNIYGTGSDSYLRRLKKLAQERRNIIFRGGVKYDEMHMAYAANEVIVVPSIWYETYNFVIHEALLMGKVVIAARIGAMSECIVDGDNGFTFRPGDWDDLKSVMQEVAGNNRSLNNNLNNNINTINFEFDQYNSLYKRS